MEVHCKKTQLSSSWWSMAQSESEQGLGMALCASHSNAWFGGVYLCVRNKVLFCQGSWLLLVESAYYGLGMQLTNWPTHENPHMSFSSTGFKGRKLIIIPNEWSTQNEICEAQYTDWQRATRGERNIVPPVTLSHMADHSMFLLTPHCCRGEIALTTSFLNLLAAFISHFREQFPCCKSQQSATFLRAT